MKLYVENRISARDKDSRNIIDNVLKEFESAIAVHELSCHALVRAIRHIIPIGEVTDGRFSTLWDHSWITTVDGNILDVYPVACIGSGVLLLDGSPESPWSQIYTDFGNGYHAQKAKPEHVQRLIEELVFHYQKLRRV